LLRIGRQSRRVGDKHDFENDSPLTAEREPPRPASRKLEAIVGRHRRQRTWRNHNKSCGKARWLHKRLSNSGQRLLSSVAITLTNCVPSRFWQLTSQYVQSKLHFLSGSVHAHDNPPARGEIVT
jgi:hypothetical protein